MPVYVAEMDVSCLVDTCAGVSLLNGNVLDKIDQRNIMEPQKLVGVDGIPLKVHGASTFHLIMACLEFKHRSIIADNITADAIFGLDFWVLTSVFLIVDKGSCVSTTKPVFHWCHTYLPKLHSVGN